MTTINNQVDLIANSLSLINSDGTLSDVKHLIATAAEDLTGILTTESITTIGALSAALDNNPNYFQDTQDAIDSKANQSTSYLKSEVNTLLDAKQNELTLTSPLMWNFDPENPLINNIIVDSYSKSEVDNKFSVLTSGAPSALDTFLEISQALNSDPNLASTLTTQIATKAPQATTYTKTEVDNSLASKANQSTTYTKAEMDMALGNKQSLLSYTAPSDGFAIGNNVVVKGVKAGSYLSISEAANTLTFDVNVQTALDTKANQSTTYTKAEVDTSLATKAPLASPSFTGTVSGISKSMVGLSNVDNTSDASKPISTATQTALDLKAPLASPSFTGTVSGISKSMVGLSNVDNTSDASKPISASTQSALDLKAPLASPTFTGTVGGITKSMVGLSNVDNTSDASKPISTSTQSALDLKAPLASPTFTGTVGGITKSMVGLSNVDNTSDVNKPVSTATTTALNLKYDISTANNTACAWSSGLVGDAYHYLTGGTDALVLRSNGGNVAMNILGSTSGSLEGKVFFYKPVELTSTLTLPGSVDVLTTLNAKANQSTTYTKTEVDNSLAAKANQSTTYTKAEMDMALGNKQSTLSYTTPSGGYAIGNNVVVKGVKAGTYLSLSDASNILTYDLNRTVTDTIYESVFDAIAPIQKSLNLVNGHWEVKLASNLGNILMNNLSVTNNIASNSINAYNANQVTVNDNLTVTGNLIVNGSASIASSNPFWIAGFVDGATVTITYQRGLQTATVARVSGQATGVFRITFPTHPNGTSYVVQLTPNYYGQMRVYETTPVTSTYFDVATLDRAGTIAVNGKFYFAVI